MPLEHEQVESLIRLTQEGFKSLAQDVKEAKGATEGDIGRLGSQIQVIQQTLEPMAEVFRGRDGKESLETRIVILERDVKEIRDKTRQASVWQRGLIASTIVAIISAVISTVAAFVIK